MLRTFVYSVNLVITTKDMRCRRFQASYISSHSVVISQQSGSDTRPVDPKMTTRQVLRGKCGSNHLPMMIGGNINCSRRSSSRYFLRDHTWSTWFVPVGKRRLRMLLQQRCAKFVTGVCGWGWTPCVTLEPPPGPASVHHGLLWTQDANKRHVFNM